MTTRPDIEGLRERAEKATGARWEQRGKLVAITAPEGAPFDPAGWVSANEIRRVDAAHIAGCDPQTVLAWCEYTEQLEDQLADIEAIACRELDSARQTIESLTRDIRAHEHRGARDKELAHLRSRVAELEGESHVVHQWGLELINKLGEFLEISLAEWPMTVRIECKFKDEDGEPFPVLYLWATLDDERPEARLADLRAESDRLREENERLKCLLEDADDLRLDEMDETDRLREANERRSRWLDDELRALQRGGAGG